MTSRNRVRAGFAVALACAASISTAAAAEQHNFVVLVPESLATATVDPMTAPTLAKLRAEGVYFINSHTAFPAEELAGPVLGKLAAPSTYVTVQVDSPGVERIVGEVLPELKKGGQPFLLVYRLGEPAPAPHADATDESQADNSDDVPASMMTLLEADEALAAIEKALKSLGLYESTNIVVAAEHGFSTVWKESRSSASLAYSGKKQRRDQLPPGFLAIDIVDALQAKDAGLVLFDPHDDNSIVAYTSGEYPSQGDAIIAVDPLDPYAVVEAHGGYDFIYLPEGLARAETRRRAGLIVDALLGQDYVGGLFVDEVRLGRVRGALSVEHLGFREGVKRKPTIVVSFASESAGCDREMVCTWTVADTTREEGETLHGGLSRAETSNFIAARGPDFQRRVVSRVPAGSADVVATLAELMHAGSGEARKGGARVLTEGLRGHEKESAPTAREKAVESKASEDGLVAEVRYQVVGKTRYFDAAGFGGWTVGIPEREEPVEWRPWRWDWPKWKRFSIEISPD